jgi:hypothetical protein
VEAVKVLKNSVLVSVHVCVRAKEIFLCSIMCSVALEVCMILVEHFLHCFGNFMIK